jgi:pyruvate/2-oxoglutarate dehydrogenase complex dihydrolipoamide dehydrogenase (E3) component
MSLELELLAGDPHDRALIEAAHPPRWENPTPSGRYNLVVVGGGTAGLVSAIGAASLGGKVALVEARLMGGDCLNFGCVPSKGIIAAGRAAQAVREAGEFGVRAGEVHVDFAVAMERMRLLRVRIAKNDSAERLRSLGVDVYFGRATFVAPDAVEVDGRRLAFARAILATGSRPATLDLPGLAEAGFLTNETIFSLTELPRRLAVVGAGPVGCELAQTFRRLGSEVTVLSRGSRLLPKDDADAASLLEARFRTEGIRLELGAKLLRVEPDRTLVHERGRIAADAILVAVGRARVVAGLGLEAAGVASGPQGVFVDDHLRTTNPRIFAAGDVASRFQFTHAADALARVALQNALFFGRKRQSALVVPWCTYTDPEIAHVGLSAQEARERGATTFTVPLEEVDRAVLDGETEGFARIHAGRRGRILGATLVAAHAGESIGELSLAMTAGLTLADLARTIHPYPTQAEALKRAGDAHLRTRLTPRLRGFLTRLMRWRR